MKNKIPTTIFSGFLGSGKTTIISNLIEILQKKEQQIVYIKNEIGNSDIDTKIIQGKGIKTKELLNGCICCTLVGPFVNSITEVVETFKPDRILIEASGAADPSALALMVSSHSLLERDGVIGIIDVVNFEGYKDLSITTQNQTKFIDLIIFNKIELADIKQKQAVVGYVRELNTHSPILEAPNGKIDPEIIFGINHKELDKLLINIDSDDINHNHIHQDNIQSFTIKTKKIIKKSDLTEFLESLPKNIFRAKGIITFPDMNKYLFNTVGNRTKISKIDNQNITENVFIFIGSGINEYESEANIKLQNLLK